LQFLKKCALDGEEAKEEFAGERSWNTLIWMKRDKKPNEGRIKSIAEIERQHNFMNEEAG